MSERQQQVKERKEAVYSPIQNFPIDGHYYLNTSLSDSSEKVDKRSFPRAYQLSEAVDQHYSLGDKPHDFEALRIAVSDEDNISEVTAYPSEGDFEEGVVSAWKQQVSTLVILLTHFLDEHLDECCEAELLVLIYRHIEYLLSELFPEEIALRVWRIIDQDLQAILSQYATEKLRDCIEDLLVDMSGLFSSQDVMFITLSNSLPQQQLSYESEDGEGCERDIRDQARDDALASVTQSIPPQVATEAENVTDRTFTLSDCDGLFIERHKHIESHSCTASVLSEMNPIPLKPVNNPNSTPDPPDSP